MRQKHTGKQDPILERPMPAVCDDPRRDDRQFVTALARGLEIMSCFSLAKPEMGGTQLAAMTGLPQPTVWRLCHTMVQQGYLVPVSSDKLRPGIPLLKLGRAALASIPFAERSREGMLALADKFGSASGLAARDGGRMVFVQRCMSEAQLVMNLRIGARLPLVTSAVGWGILAGFDKPRRDALIAQYDLPDPHWPKVEKVFKRAMEEFETQGYILNLGVLHEGYNAAAAPIFDHDGRPAFAISCAGSAVTHTLGFLRKQIAPELLKLRAVLQHDFLSVEPPRRPRRATKSQSV